MLLVFVDVGFVIGQGVLFFVSKTGFKLEELSPSPEIIPVELESVVELFKLGIAQPGGQVPFADLEDGNGPDIPSFHYTHADSGFISFRHEIHVHEIKKQGIVEVVFAFNDLIEHLEFFEGIAHGKAQLPEDNLSFGDAVSVDLDGIDNEVIGFIFLGVLRKEKKEEK